MRRWQFGRWAVVLVLTGVSGCGVSSVRSVQQQPQRNWFNSTVELEGKVVDRIPLINAAVYQLQDETGKIWILTDDASLQSGEQLRVKGKVRFESIPIGEQDLGEAYIEEEKREVVLDDRK